jgi:hypothetical protein
VTGVFLSRPLFSRFLDQDFVRTAAQRFFESGRSAAQTCAQIRMKFHWNRKLKLAFKPDWLPLGDAVQRRSAMHIPVRFPFTANSKVIPGDPIEQLPFFRVSRDMESITVRIESNCGLRPPV